MPFTRLFPEMGIAVSTSSSSPLRLSTFTSAHLSQKAGWRQVWTGRPAAIGALHLKGRNEMEDPKRSKGCSALRLA
jgi:hypothetical protein